MLFSMCAFALLGGFHALMLRKYRDTDDFQVAKASVIGMIMSWCTLICGMQRFGKGWDVGLLCFLGGSAYASSISSLLSYIRTAPSAVHTSWDRFLIQDEDAFLANEEWRRGMISACTAALVTAYLLPHICFY